MRKEACMKRTLAVTVLSLLVLVPRLWTADAWARVGGGSSGGSRGSRSYSAPARPSSPSPTSPSTPASPMQPAPPRSGWGGMGGMLGGLLVGGLIGSLLFGGHGGGFGILEILIVGGLVWFANSYMRRRREAAAPFGYAAPDDAQRWQPSAQYGSASAASRVTGPVDLERGLGYIRQMDPGFDPKLM